MKYFFLFVILFPHYVRATEGVEDLNVPALSLDLAAYGETQLMGVQLALPLTPFIAWRFGTFGSQRTGLNRPGAVDGVWGMGWTSDLVFNFPLYIKDLIRPYLVSELNGIREFSPNGSGAGWSARMGFDFRLTRHYNSFFELGISSALSRQDDIRPLSGAVVMVGSSYRWK